jgi:hypothetical protein
MNLTLDAEILDINLTEQERLAREERDLSFREYLDRVSELRILRRELKERGLWGCVREDYLEFPSYSDHKELVQARGVLTEYRQEYLFVLGRGD